MNQWMRIGVLSVLALCTANAGQWKDGPYLTYPNGGEIRHEEMGFGWQVNYEFNPYFSTELSISHQTDTLNDIALMPAPFSNEWELDIMNISLSARLGHQWDRFAVYAATGIGYNRMDADAEKIRQSIHDHSAALPSDLLDYRLGIDVKNAFGYHVAVGAEFLITPQWELFAEYRWVYLDTHLTVERIEARANPDPKPLEIDKSLTKSKTDFDYDHGLFRLGVNYRF